MLRVAYISHIFSVSFPVPPFCVPLSEALFFFILLEIYVHMPPELLINFPLVSDRQTVGLVFTTGYFIFVLNSYLARESVS